VKMEYFYYHFDLKDFLPTLGPFGPNMALLPVDILSGVNSGKFESWPLWPFFGPFA
jgi:hypothetical protein